MCPDGGCRSHSAPPAWLVHVCRAAKALFQGLSHAARLQLGGPLVKFVPPQRPPFGIATRLEDHVGISRALGSRPELARGGQFPAERLRGRRRERPRPRLARCVSVRDALVALAHREPARGGHADEAECVEQQRRVKRSEGADSGWRGGDRGGGARRAQQFAEVADGEQVGGAQRARGGQLARRRGREAQRQLGQRGLAVGEGGGRGAELGEGEEGLGALGIERDAEWKACERGRARGLNLNPESPGRGRKGHAALCICAGARQPRVLLLGFRRQRRQDTAGMEKRAHRPGRRSR